MVATAIILLATWGGTEYSWGSWEIIGLLLLALAGLAAFLAVERRAAEPMLPLHVFKIRNFSVTMVLTFLVGLGLFGAMTFLPFYQQTVQGASPTVSGLLLTPLMVGSALTSILAGAVTSKTGKYRMFPIIGGLVMAVGMFLLSRIGVTTPRWQTGIDYVVLGLGMGFLMQMMSLIAQNSVGLRDMGVASSARMFFQQMGGSLGVAAFGAVFAHKLTETMSGIAGGRRGEGQRRVARPDDGHQPSARGAGGRVHRHRARGADRLPVGDPGVGPGLPAGPAHQGSAVARPGSAGRGGGPGARGRGPHRLAVTSAGSYRLAVLTNDTGAKRDGRRRLPSRRRPLSS